MGFRVLAVNNFLDHCTARTLRALNLSEFTALLTQTVHLAREICPVQFGTAAVDSHNIRTISYARSPTAGGQLKPRSAQ